MARTVTQADLETAFAEAGRREGDTCPPSEALARLAAEELEPSQRDPLVAHLTVCADCAEDYRLARDVHGNLGLRKARRGFSGVGVMWLAAAAALLLGIGIPLALLRAPSEPDVFRGPQEVHIESRLDVDRPLPRQRCLLLWSVSPRAARFTLYVDGADGGRLYEARDVIEPEHLVPQQALSGLDAGAALSWRVEALLPDGTRALSPRFEALLE